MSNYKKEDWEKAGFPAIRSKSREALESASRVQSGAASKPVAGVQSDTAVQSAAGVQLEAAVQSAVGVQSDAAVEAVVREVLKRLKAPERISLETAKRLIEKIEEESARRGQQSVIAVCGPDGNPIAIHVMDGAFLVSFQVAMQKAYTAVAVKMSTMKLNALAQPGQTFYGIDKVEGGNISILGGGVPLKVGDTVIGGLAVSGGTGEADDSLAEYGLSVLESVL